MLRAALYLYHAPNAGNHEFLAFFADCSIALALVLSRFGGSDGLTRATFAIGYIFPLLRAATVALYFFAVLHKLNTCYLSPESCGGTLLWNYVGRNSITASLAGYLPTQSDWLRYTSIYVGLAVEAAIPILLLSRRTAWAGCLLGIGFHFLLGFFYFWHFTPLLYVLFLSFLPIDFFRELSRSANRALGSRFFDVAIWVAIGLLVSLFVGKQYNGMIRWELGQFSREAPNSWRFGANIRTVIGLVPFVALSFLFTYCVYKYARTGGARIAQGRLTWPIAVLSLVLFGNGLTPYFGLKTHASFAMFSGLSVAQGVSNHLFMPSVPLTHHTLDIVTPAGPDFSNYQKELRWKSDEALLFFELRKRIAALKGVGAKDIRISYYRNGERIDLANAESDAELTQAVGWFDRKFRVFQPIPIDSCSCRY